MTLVETILQSIPGNPLQGLRYTDRLWEDLRHQSIDEFKVIEESNDSLGNTDWDIVICGGTLGIFLAASLQHKGWKVALIERGILRGREQEWNISRQELEVFVQLELLTEAELEEAIATEYTRGRVSFLGGKEVWVKDVLNIGIDPVFLLETLKNKFINAGGKLWEKTSFTSATIHTDGVFINTNQGNFKTRLLIDAMGHFSPISKQARQGKKPTGICLVVGSCAQGYDQNDTGDLIVSFTPIQNQCQYFWEAFPAKDGRTTYLFTYVDIHQTRPSLEFLLEEYLRLLPEYQNVELSQLQFQRFLFGFFPAYRQSPLKTPWHRLLAVGDSSGAQSPVSFGGFGAMVRHLSRLTFGIDEALKIDFLTNNALSLLQPYQPNIAITWLFQKAMSVDIARQVEANSINNLMSGVFQVMDKLDEDVLKSFLQDVIQFAALSQTLPLVNPKLVLPLLPQIGIASLLDWTKHYFNLAFYSVFYPLGKVCQPMSENFSPQAKYYYHRWIDALKYGSGADYHF